jgi:hypothetical protein
LLHGAEVMFSAVVKMDVAALEFYEILIVKLKGNVYV